MNEVGSPLVTELRFNVVATEPTTQSPVQSELLEFPLGGFSCRLEEGVLTAVPDNPYSSLQAAREAITPFLRSWQVWSLTAKGVALDVTFISAVRGTMTEELKALRVRIE
jgi:hypothetical protein